MKENLFAQLFIDDGSGFSEESSIRIPISHGEVQLDFELKEFNKIRRLRLDPVNQAASLSNLLVQSVSGDETQEMTYGNSNADWMDTEGNVLFLSSDPNIFLRVFNQEFIDQIRVSFYYHDDIEILQKFGERIVDLDTDSARYHVKQINDLVRSINAKLTVLEADMSFQKNVLNKTSREIASLYKDNQGEEEPAKKESPSISPEHIKSALKDEMKLLLSAINKLSDQNESQAKQFTQIVSDIKADDKSQKVISDVLTEVKNTNTKALDVKKHLEIIKKDNDSIKKSIKNWNSDSKKQEEVMNSINLGIKNLEKLSKASIDRENSKILELKEQLKIAEEKNNSNSEKIDDLQSQIAVLSKENLALQSISEQYNKLLEELETLIEE